MNLILCLLLSLFLITEAIRVNELWFKFKNEHGKVYDSSQEQQLRFEIFRENIIRIEKHNAKFREGKETYYLGVNQFADMTTTEFKDKIGNEGYFQIKNNDFSAFEIKKNDLPYSVDWRLKGIVTDVKNQGMLSESWSFSATGSLEGQLAINTTKLQSLSEQQLVDCVTKNGNMEMAYQYVEDKGLASEGGYYSDTGECRDDSIIPAIRIRDYKFVKQDENSLKAAVATVGPISVTIEANANWQFYVGGIFDGDCPGSSLNHAVLVVGYNSIADVQNGDNVTMDYWIIKNSWGVAWGENGYIKLARNRNNKCGIADYALYPIM